MEKLITGIHLPSELCSLIENAEKTVYLVCPFIELHHHFKRALNKHVENENIKIVLLYGKFTNSTHYKLIDEDLNFLKTFPNIQVRYHARLHAKFYANEKNALITSLNMNHSSHNNNLEYGIKIDLDTSDIAADLISFIDEIMNESEIIYEKTPTGSSQNLKITGTPISTIKDAFPRAFEKWTHHDDARLEKLFCEKKTIDEIAKNFQRQPSAIRARINKLELYEKYAL